MFSQEPLVDARHAAFSRLASRVLESLNEAVEKRSRAGVSRTKIAEKIGCHRSQLTKVLNGSTSNLTLRTISDILWATDFDPRDFRADPVEDLTLNCPTHGQHELEYVQMFAPVRTVTVDLSGSVDDVWLLQTPIRQLRVEHAVS
jgi:DNA-binding phage protein